MKAVVYKGPYHVAVEEVENPILSKHTDAVLTVTSTAICGSDLHTYEGRTTVKPGTVLGHEIMGIIDNVGKAVKQIKPGDRVVLPCNIACGFCANCIRGLTNACLFINPDGVGATYGNARVGPLRGGQSQKVLVPYADFNALKLPGQAYDDYEDDFLMLADIFPAAWYATELAHISEGSVVAVYGAGPVGLLSIMSAYLRGATVVYAIDSEKSRLKKAKKMKATPIDFTKAKPSQQINALRFQNVGYRQRLRPGEEKVFFGVDAGIDAVGYQANDFNQPSHEAADVVLNDLIDVVVPGGSIGIIGLYVPIDTNAVNLDHQRGRYNINFGLLWNKSIQIGTGQCPVKRFNAQLRDLIIDGRAEPGRIITHHISLEEAPLFYQRLDQRESGIHKIVIHPNDR